MTSHRTEGSTTDDAASSQEQPWLPTAAVSDALDKLGLTGSLHGLGALRPGQRTTGPAFTIRYGPVGESGGTVGDFLDDVPAGAVVVIDNGGRTDCTVWGGIMTTVAAERHIAGTVVHGACRDVATSRTTDYPLWSAGVFMRTGKDRVRVVEVGGPVTVDGVTIAAGDVLVADDDGVVAVPADRWDDVRELAQRIEDIEAAIVTTTLAGATLAAARAQHGYHSLQTPGSER